MAYLSFQRITEVCSTTEIVWDNVSDYTHFPFAHRSHFSKFEILMDDGLNQAFYYESKIMAPLPFCRRYIAIREMDHEENFFRQTYKDIATGQVHYFSCRVTSPDAQNTQIDNKFVFEISDSFKWIKGLLGKLIDRRLHAMWLEDLEILEVRTEHGGFDNETCSPQIDSLQRVLIERFSHFHGSHFENAPDFHTYVPRNELDV